ncbi:type I restriction-modification system subunit M/S [Saccharopolyspora shandongensis]|uniref:type I restriction-modification system subunit M/S n=1 Tax=Saccharopolyspora shandongensis TaxID=418495 RepID=UPI00340135F2
MTDQLSASEIARAAGVGRAAVSNWRERDVDFPAASHAGRFSTSEVAAWLDKRRIPRNALREDEAEGTSYGHRFRRTLGLADREPAPARHRGQARHGLTAKVWQLIGEGLREQRGAATTANYQEFILALLYARENDVWQPIREQADHADHDSLATLLAELSITDPLFSGLRFSSEVNPHLLTGIVDGLNELGGAEQPAADRRAAGLLDDLLNEFSSFRMTNEFHTPRSIVELAVSALGPTDSDTVYDPCCGNGALLVGAIEHVRRHLNKPRREITGRALSPVSWRLASMNLALHGIEPDLGGGAHDVLRRDMDRGRKFDVIMTNPPFAMRDWTDQPHDPRWRYGTPPRSSANFAWMQHVLDKLAPGGRAAVVMAPAASFAGGVEARIRRRLVDARTVAAVIELPAGLFRATGIPVHLWLLRAPAESDGRVLLISAKNLGRAAGRSLHELADSDIAKIVAIHQQHQLGVNVLEPGFARSVDVAEICQQNYQLQPGIYLSSPQARFRPAKLAITVAEQRQQLSALTRHAAELKDLVARQLDRIDPDGLASRNSRPTLRAVPLGEVCDVLAGPSGMLREIPADEHGIPVLTPRSLRRNRLVLGKSERVDPIARERLARYILEAGDVLCSRTGTIGRTALVTAEHQGALFGPGFLRLRPHWPELSNHYLLHYLAAEWAQDWMDEHCARTTIPSLSAKTMRQLPIWLPPLDQQEAITEIMSSLDEQLALQDEVADTTERLKHHLGLLIGAGDFPLRD